MLLHKNNMTNKYFLCSCYKGGLFPLLLGSFWNCVCPNSASMFLHFYSFFFSNYWYSLSFPSSPPFFLRRFFCTFLFYSFFSRKFFYLSNRLNFSPLSSFTLPKSWGVLLCMIQSWDACCLSENSGNFRGLPAYFIWATRSIRRTFSLQMTNKKEISPPPKTAKKG